MTTPIYEPPTHECKPELEAGSAYNFLTRAPEIFGLKISNAVLESVVTYKVASRSTDIPGFFEATLPVVLTYHPNVSTNPNDYQWLEFTKDDDTQMIIPLEWIVTGSIELYGSNLVTIEITDVNAEERVAISSFLGKIGVRSKIRFNIR